MFRNFKLQRLQRSADLAELKDGLLFNLTSDLYYSDYPHACRLRETLEDGDIRYQIVGNPAAAKRIVITVSEGDQTRGTLVHEMPGGELRLRLHPHNDRSRDDQWLLSKLMRLAAIDHERRQPAARTAALSAIEASPGASIAGTMPHAPEDVTSADSRIIPMRVAKPDTLSQRPARRDTADNVIRFPFPRKP